MNWEAMGAVGEIVGAVGVLVTLGFLVNQLRQNTKALQGESFHNAAVMIHHPTTLMIQDAEITEIHARGNENYESLDAVERDRYHYLMVQRIHAIEMIDSYDGAGLAEGWFADSCRLIVIRLAEKPGFRQWWGERGRHLFGERFRDWTQGLVDSAAAATAAQEPA